jgi:hypothetical protein
VEGPAIRIRVYKGSFKVRKDVDRSRAAAVLSSPQCQWQRCCGRLDFVPAAKKDELGAKAKKR